MVKLKQMLESFLIIDCFGADYYDGYNFNEKKKILSREIMK